MTCNIGRTGRIVRIAAGLAIIGVGFYFQNWWGGIGVLPVMVGIIGYCPPWTKLLKISNGKASVSAAPPASR